MIKPHLQMICLTLFLTGCAANTEMPYEPVDTDQMRPSPCACLELDYQPQTFEWVNAAQA